MEPNAGHSARSSMYFCWAWEGVIPWDGGREWVKGERGKENYIDCVLLWSLPSNFMQNCTGASMHIHVYSNTIHSVLHIMTTNLIPIPR